MVGVKKTISRKEFQRRARVPAGAVAPRVGGGFTAISRAEFRRRGGARGIRKTFEAQEKIPSGVTSITRPGRGGQSITVTRSGKVTIRDARGALVDRFRTTELQAARFISQKRTFSERVISTLKRQGKRAFLGSAGEVISIDPITGRKTVIAGRQVIARVPVTAKVDVARIAILRRKRERLGVTERRQLVKSQIRDFVRFEVDPNLPTNIKAQIRKEQTNFKRFLTRIPPGTIGLSEAEKRFRALTKKPFFGIPGLGGRPSPLEKTIKQVEEARKRAETKRLRIAKVPPLERQLIGIIVQPSIAVATAVTSFLTLIRHPIRTIGRTIKAFSPREIKGTVTSEIKRFIDNPLAVVTEYAVFFKLLRLTGRAVRNTPLAQTIAEEAFIASQPIKFRPSLRSIIRADRVQRIINPNNLPVVKNFQVFKPTSMNLIEFKAALKTISQSNSVLFGSGAGKALQRKALKPKDLDIATRNINVFNRLFVNNLPSIIRKNYILKGQKLIRKTNKQALFDIKPLGRLIPQRGIITRIGRLPVVGIKKKIKITKFTKRNLANLKKVLKKNIQELRKLKPKTRAERIKIRQAIINNRRLLGLAKRKGLRSKKILTALGDIKEIGKLSLPKIERELRIRLTIPTQKLVEITTPLGRIKVVSFAETTSRKALGTIQLIIEKEVRRAKDPAGLLVNLKIQRDFLKSQKPLSLLGKRRITILTRAIRLLQSKAFANLIRKRIGIINQFPALKKINVRNLRKINLKNVNRKVRVKVREAIKSANRLKQLSKRLKLLRKKKPRTKRARLRLNKIRNKIRAEIKRIRLQLKKTVGQETLNKAGISKLPKFKPSRIPRIKPTRLPKIKPSRIPRIPPTRLPKVRPSKLPVSILPSSLRPLSKIPSIIPIIISISKIPPSRIPSRLVPSRVPPSRVPPPPPPPIFVPPPPEKVIIDEEKKKKKLRRLAGKVIQKQVFIYLADLYSRIYGIFADPKEKRAFLRVGRIFTGAERRAIIRRRGSIKKQRTSRRSVSKSTKRMIIKGLSKKDQLRLRKLNRRLRILKRKLPRARKRKTRARIIRTIKRIRRSIKKLPLARIRR